MSGNFPFEQAMLFNHNNDATLIELTLRAASIMNAISETYWNDNTYTADDMLHCVNNGAPASPVTWYGINAPISQGFKDETDSFMAGNESAILAAGTTANPGMDTAEQDALRAIMVVQSFPENTLGTLETLMAGNNVIYADNA